MRNGDITIQFQGFSPSDHSREFMEEKLAEIREESPFGAALRASFTRQKNRIKGIIRVTSKRGQFFAVASGEYMDDVSRMLFNRIRRQLLKWKANRFKIKVPPVENPAV